MIERKKKAHDIMNDARRLMTESKVDDAITKLDEASSIYDEIYADDMAYLGDYYMKLGTLCLDQLDRCEKAVSYYKRATQCLEKLDDKKELAYTYYTLAEIYYLDLDKLSDAADMLNNALKLYLDIDDNKSIECLIKLANIYMQLDDKKIAIDAISKAMTLRCAVNPSSNQTASLLHDAGKMCFEMSAFDNAMEYMKKAADIYLEIEGEDSEDYIAAINEYKMVKAYKGYELH